MAGKYDITIEQGATFTLSMTVKKNGSPVDLTGYTARMQARPHAGSSAVYLDLSSVNKITLGGPAGTIVISLTAAETAALPTGTFVYDLELISPLGVTTRLLAGRVVVSAEVTRDNS